MDTVTTQSAGLAAMVTFALGLLVGASLVAVALARREASLSRWAAQLQRRDSSPTTATGPDPGAIPVNSPGVPGFTPRRRLCIGRTR